jgi:glucuronoarabinoxylan endo-1,4-beta-xylanase
MKKLLTLPLLLVAVLLLSARCKKSSSGGNQPPQVTPTTSEATIDLLDVKQTISGFGGATVFRPTTPLTAAELDKLFGTGAGQIGLTILRIRLASDTDPNWRNLELTNAQGAKQRGAIVIGTPWSPPERMKTNGNLIGGSLKPDSAGPYAKYLNDFANYMAANNAALYAVSVQNEPDIAVSYESCNWTASELFNFVKNNADVVTSTKLIAPESFNFNKTASDMMLNDATATANLDIVGGHIYGNGLVDYPLARSKNKEVWMTEHLDTNVTWASVMSTAQEIHNCLSIANFNAYIWWYAKRFYGPIGETGDVTQRGYVMANFSKFIRPGYRRVNAGVTKGGSTILVSAYRGAKAVVVAINLVTTPTNFTFKLDNIPVTSMTPYTTSASKNLEQGAAITGNANSFTFQLPGESITTFVEN